jgi:hypothetical protein
MRVFQFEVNKRCNKRTAFYTKVGYEDVLLVVSAKNDYVEIVIKKLF